MHVIVTGGTGLIGRALVGDLSRDGIEVTVLSRDPGRSRALPSGVRRQRWDGRTADGWGHLADGADAVVNLAGAGLSDGRWTAARRRLILESRVMAGQAVCEAIQAAANKPAVVVQSSAVGFYGSRGDEVVGDDSPPGEGFLADVCRQWEASTAPVEEMGVRRAVMRTGVVFDGSGGALPRMLLPFRLGVGGRLGDGRQWLSWIHMADMVAGIRFLIDRDDLAGAVNVTAPDPVTNAEFARVAGQVLGRPSFFAVPALALRLAFGQMADVLLEGQRVVPRRLTSAGFRFGFPGAEAALRAILG